MNSFGENRASNTASLQVLTEKDRLKNLEKEIASRLEQLRKKMHTAQNRESKENNVNNLNNSKSYIVATQKCKRRKSLLELDPTTKPKLPADASVPRSVSPELKLRDMAENLSNEKLGLLKKLTEQTFSLSANSTKAAASCRKSKKFIELPFLLGDKQAKVKPFHRKQFFPYFSPLLAFRSYR